MILHHRMCAEYYYESGREREQRGEREEHVCIHTCNTYQKYAYHGGVCTLYCAALGVVLRGVLCRLVFVCVCVCVLPLLFWCVMGI